MKPPAYLTCALRHVPVGWRFYLDGNLVARVPVPEYGTPEYLYFDAPLIVGPGVVSDVVRTFGVCIADRGLELVIVETP